MMKTSRFLSIALVFIMMASCSESYLEENPPNIFSSDLLLQDYDGFEASLNGMYTIARHGRWQSEKIENAINGVDNFTSNRRRSPIFWQWGSINSPDDKDLKETWGWLYEIIYAANNIITHAEDENVDWVGGGNSAVDNKNRIVAEARALRAWAYRRLTWSWGDVPLTTNLIRTIVTDWERTPIAQVRAQMITDFRWAQQYVPTEASLQGRITKGAVQTFLAESYLTINKPDSALYWADQVINNPAYQLVTERYGVFKDDPSGSPYGDMFKHTPDQGNQNREDGNTEALWVWQFKLYDPLDGQGHELSRAITGEYNLIRQENLTLQFTYARGGRGKNYFNPTRWWVLSYEDQDDRAQNYIMRKFFILKTAEENDPGNGADVLPNDVTWAYGDTIWLDWSEANDITADNYKVNNFPFSRKGEGTDPNDMAADFAWSDQIYLRLADTYLLKAEALFKLGRSAEAADVIKIIRERSNATP
jgi:hypothetical protein